MDELSITNIVINIGFPKTVVFRANPLNNLMNCWFVTFLIQ